jgi:hypothetical protein
MSDLIIIVSEQLGNAYSIDSEGTLFSTPLYLDGKVNTNDWDIVENYDDPEVNVIHQDLITTYKALGWYYQDAKV